MSAGAKRAKVESRGVIVGLEFPSSNDFKNVYYRSSSRANGQRNIRCFPTCSPMHNEKNFCGRTVKVVVHLCVDASEVNTINFNSICCIGEYKPLESSNCISGALSGEALRDLVRLKSSNQRSTYWGRLVETFLPEAMGGHVILKAVFEFNSELRGWSYAWQGRFCGSARHVFSVTVMLLHRTRATKSAKPVWPFHLGVDFPADEFFPVGFFDSPSFTFGSFRDRPEGNQAQSGISLSHITPPHVHVPEGYDPDVDPQLLGLPSALLCELDLSPASVRRAYESHRDCADFDQVQVESLVLRLRHGLPAQSVLSQLLRSAPDPLAYYEHRRRLEALARSPSAQADDKAIHDYFYRLKLLKATFDPDIVRHQFVELGQLPQVPFPYRAAPNLLPFVNRLLGDDNHEAKLLIDLLSLNLVFPVAVEPAIYLLQTLRSPICVDAGVFSRSSTLIRSDTLDDGLGRADSGALTSQLSLPSAFLLSGDRTRSAQSIWSLSRLCSLSSLPRAPSAPTPHLMTYLSCSSAGWMPSWPPVELSEDVNVASVPAEVPCGTEDQAGAWSILRMVTEYYSTLPDRVSVVENSRVDTGTGTEGGSWPLTQVEPHVEPQVSLSTTSAENCSAERFEALPPSASPGRTAVALATISQHKRA